MIKRVAAIIALVIVASLSVAGCTTTVTNPTTSPSSTSLDMTAKLNNAYASQNYTLVKPFTRAVNQYGNAVYTGVVKDGEDTLVPYIHNMTFEEAKNRNDSLTRFDAYVAQALTQGYAQGSNSTGMWFGTIGAGINPAKEVMVRINQPNTGIQVGTLGNAVSLSNYTVSADYMTKA